MATTGTLDVKQTPVEGMKVQQQTTNPVGGKVIIFDGKTDKTETDKAKETEKKVDGAATTAKEGEQKAGDKTADEKLDDGLKALRKSLGFWKDDKKTDDKAADDKKKADDAAAAKAKDDKKADDKKTDDKNDKEDDRPRATKRQRSNLTPELVETVAQTAVRAAVEANKAAQPKPEKQTDAEDALSDADKRDLEVFKYLEKQAPDKYKGAAKQFIKFTSEYERYRTKWEEENPDKPFDPQAEEHDPFYEKHQPKHDPTDLEEAKINMRLEQKLKERDVEHDARYGQLETRLLEKDLAPVIDRKAGEAVAAMVGEVDKDLAKVLLEKGPDAVAEADPIAFDVLDKSAADLRGALTELEKLSHPSGRFRFDKNNPIHDSLDRFAVGLERSIKGLPMDEQIRDGKMFATQTELRSIPENQRGRYWVLTPEDIGAHLVQETAAASKKIIESERARIEKYAKSRGLVAAKSTDDGKGGGAQSSGGTSDKPKSPAASTDAGNAAAMKVGDTAGDPAIKTLVSRLFPS